MPPFSLSNFFHTKHPLDYLAILAFVFCLVVHFFAILCSLLFSHPFLSMYGLLLSDWCLKKHTFLLIRLEACSDPHYEGSLSRTILEVFSE